MQDREDERRLPTRERSVESSVAASVYWIIGRVPPVVQAVLEARAATEGARTVHFDPDGVDEATATGERPQLIVLGSSSPNDARVSSLVSAFSRDRRWLTVPRLVVAVGDQVPWLDAGADEVLDADAGDIRLIAARIEALLRRSRSDQEVHPSTRLPGSDAIRAAIGTRLADEEVFAACYADLDHFKEFNDRYGFSAGDAVIRSVAMLLTHHVEQHAGPTGFVGHIGGDDFLFLIPASVVPAVCSSIIEAADRDLPARYSARDREAGYFLGKDRRGRLDRVPLMTLSIGVATNERRRFTSVDQVSSLVSEMKSYAKSRPGSIWVADRRVDAPDDQSIEESQA
jgi:GGDEF domain-containing protein